MNEELKTETGLSAVPMHPESGINYGLGYIGFTYPADPGHITRGITWFTRWSRLSDIRVSHALIVTGENECIEAQLGQGVIRRPLSDYFDGEYDIFFRKPRNLTMHRANDICFAARMQLGKRYDKALIYSHAILGSLLGRLLNKLCWNIPGVVLARLLNNPDAWICSELAAYALRSVPAYRVHGCLSCPSASITPQQLFEDNEIFSPWKDEE